MQYNLIELLKNIESLNRLHNVVSREEHKKHGFDYEEFWQWAREMSVHEIVLVNEYNAPDDFVCIWEKVHTNSMATENTYKPEKRLFIHKCRS